MKLVLLVGLKLKTDQLFLCLILSEDISYFPRNTLYSTGLVQVWRQCEGGPFHWRHEAVAGQLRRAG